MTEFILREVEGLRETSRGLLLKQDRKRGLGGFPRPLTCLGSGLLRNYESRIYKEPSILTSIKLGLPLSNARLTAAPNRAGSSTFSPATPMP